MAIPNPNTVKTFFPHKTEDFVELITSKAISLQVVKNEWLNPFF